jgi:hypothetical protein
MDDNGIAVWFLGAVDEAMSRLGGEVTRRSVFDIERELAEREDEG